MLEERRCRICLKLFECVEISERELCDDHLAKYPNDVPLFTGIYIENAVGDRLTRKHSATNPRGMRMGNYEKWLARKKVEKALFYGKLTKPEACSWCKEVGNVIHGHHDDYSKPLEVEWLCQPCHQELHNFYNKVYKVL